MPQTNTAQECHMWCGSGADIETSMMARLFEMWTFDSKPLTLRHDLYAHTLENERLPIFTSIYTILEIRKNYMKLRLEKELFEGS